MVLVSRDQYGNIRQAISAEQIGEAAKILNRLGIRHGLQSGEIWSTGEFGTSIGHNGFDFFSRGLLPTEVDWSVKEIGTRVVGKVIMANKNNRGAFILPEDEIYLLFVTFANVTGAGDMPKQGDRVEIEYAPHEVGDKCATATGRDNQMRMGHKVVILLKRV